MSTSADKALTSEELRKRLYQTFKNRGVLDSLKAQLRNQLIQELKSPPLTGQEPVPKLVPAKSDPLLTSVCNRVVADHLHTLGYEYTLSVFCPESGLSKDKFPKKDEFLQLLNVHPGSALHNSLSKKDNHEKGFLLCLLTHLSNLHAPGQCQDADAQTIGAPNYGESLVEKMKTIDKEYESSRKDQMFSFQSKLAEHRKQAEAQMEAEMNAKLKHFKEMEIAKVRLEEKTKFHKEFDNLKRDLERNYEMKAKALMEREKNSLESLKRQQEIEERNTYVQRQSMLKEIDVLRNRENELRMRTEAFEKTCQIHDDKVKTAEELLRRRELSVKTMEDTYEQNLKNEISRRQLELKEEFLKRSEKLVENESRNKLESARIQKESATLQARSEEHNRACVELSRLQVELETVQQQIALLTQQKKMLKERLETMSDYSDLKSEKAELLGQIQLLRKQMEDVQAENRQLHAERASPSSEQLALQVELQRLQNTRRLDREEFDGQKQLLQTQLQTEVDRCAQLKTQLVEHKKMSQWLANCVEDLKMRLQQTQQALENEVLRNPKPCLVDRSVLELTAAPLDQPDLYMDSGLSRARGAYGITWETNNRPQGHRSGWRDSPDSEMELVAEAKTRIQELQREADTLEEAYRNYQQRAAQPSGLTASPKLFPLQQERRTDHTFSYPRKKDFHHSPSPVSTNHRAKFSPTPHSPQGPKSPTLSLLIQGNTFPASYTSSNDCRQLQGIIHSGQSVTEPLEIRVQEHQEQNQSSPEPSSSKSQAPLEKKPRNETLQAFPPSDAVVSPVESPQQLSDRYVGLVGDFSPDFSLPRSPQLKSTAREHSSSPKSKLVPSSSESSPRLEKIDLDDLAERPESSHIPELLLDTAGPLSEKPSDGLATPNSLNLPENRGNSEGQEGSPDILQMSSESIKLEGEDEEEEEEEEEKWEKERNERQERRQRELEEAREREKRELEQLEREILLQEVKQPDGESEEKAEVDQDESEELRKEEADRKEEESKEENPLEKYMKMVLEAREKQETEGKQREETEQTSPENNSLVEDKDKSIAFYSPKEEDDDFW